MVLNIRVKRFEVLDSARTLKDKAFVATASKVMKGIKANWDRHCNNSSVQIKDWKLREIKCPKQDNRGKVQDNRQDNSRALHFLCSIRIQHEGGEATTGGD